MFLKQLLIQRINNIFVIVVAVSLINISRRMLVDMLLYNIVDILNMINTNYDSSLPNSY